MIISTRSPDGRINSPARSRNHTESRRKKPRNRSMNGKNGRTRIIVPIEGKGREKRGMKGRLPFLCPNHKSNHQSEGIMEKSNVILVALGFAVSSAAMAQQQRLPSDVY